MISNYTKLACKCQELNLPHTAQGLQDLLFDFSYELPPLTWISEHDVPFRWVGVDAAMGAKGGTRTSHIFRHRLSKCLPMIAGRGTGDQKPQTRAKDRG